MPKLQSFTMALSVTLLLTLGTVANGRHLWYRNETFDPLVYVDPLIGSANGGNVFAGATLPYGKLRSTS